MCVCEREGESGERRLREREQTVNLLWIHTLSIGDQHGYLSVREDRMDRSGIPDAHFTARAGNPHHSSIVHWEEGSCSDVLLLHMFPFRMAPLDLLHTHINCWNWC